MLPRCRIVKFFSAAIYDVLNNTIHNNYFPDLWCVEAIRLYHVPQTDCAYSPGSCAIIPRHDNTSMITQSLCGVDCVVLHQVPCRWTLWASERMAVPWAASEGHGSE